MYYSDIKPIETYYHGYRFRSRLEARWAVFFDALGLEWEYEPEGFELEDGSRYLPDFLIHNVITRWKQNDEKKDIYVEVKGIPNPTDAKKIDMFSEHYPIWVVGNIPDPYSYVRSCELQREKYCKEADGGKYNFSNNCVFCPYNYGPIDGDYCFSFSLAFDQGTLSFHGYDTSYDYGRKDSRIIEALLKARQERFEFKETPLGFAVGDIYDLSQLYLAPDKPTLCNINDTFKRGVIIKIIQNNRGESAMFLMEDFSVRRMPIKFLRNSKNYIKLVGKHKPGFINRLFNKGKQEDNNND